MQTLKQSGRLHIQCGLWFAKHWKCRKGFKHFKSENFFEKNGSLVEQFSSPAATGDCFFECCSSLKPAKNSYKMDHRSPLIGDQCVMSFPSAKQQLGHPPNIHFDSRTRQRWAKVNDDLLPRELLPRHHFRSVQHVPPALVPLIWNTHSHTQSLFASSNTI